MSIKARLKRLERLRGGRACGHGCPPVCYVYQNHWDGRDSEPPSPCPRCGRAPIVISVVYDRNFFGNADRLSAVNA